MPTIKDIARLAGVAHGTVSNVLNGRGNVSVDKIKRVEEAARTLGYQPNAQAKFLREGQSNTISIILPDISSEQYSILYEGLQKYFYPKGYELSLYLTGNRPEIEQQIIQRIATKRDFAIVTVSCLQDADDYYQALKGLQDKTIFVYRRLKNSKQFVSLDFFQAGRDIAAKLITQNYHKIGLFTNQLKNTHSQQFRQGIIEQFKQQDYPYQLTHLESSSHESTYSLAFDFFSAEKTPETLDAIVCSDIKRAEYLRNASYLGSTKACPPVYTLSSGTILKESNIHQYHMNYGMLSQQIARVIEGASPIKVVNKGFIFDENAADEKESSLAKQTLDFLILPSPSTEAVRKLLPHFKRQTGIDVNLIVRPFNEVGTILSDLSKHQHIDIIRIDMAGLPWFAETTLKPLTEFNFDPQQLNKHYSKQLIKRYSEVNDTLYGIPFDPSMQMLFYRKDLFNDATLKRFFYEKYKSVLTVPTNFEQFTQITQFFSQQDNPYVSTEYGSCITLGNAEIVASEFLLRYYAQGGKLGTEKNLLQLDKAKTLSTLQELREYLNVAMHLDASWWDKSVSLFETGQIAMVIVYMNLFSHMTRRNIAPSIGYVDVPGQQPLLGGGSLGMSKYSHKNEEVKQFFEWLFSDEIIEQIVLLGGSSARNNVFNEQHLMEQYPWLTLAKENNYQGMRENHFDNGSLINLRLAENLIGEAIHLWINHQLNDEETIEYINKKLTEHSKELIKSS
ncbi:extracellular solute-binding protein [Zophobihabitans entericus]|uniref:Extracellular solute-binding protein n=1 Tax=Zophobihabitans entericus TaxID=1635327 RepID=A0A6G9IB40_9GAMM|nr:extracellular solute-binding protein [Zophobihabitans entericus]QIQ21042.1 extracellular solute-binding protein [Zophobihabitans entericus]